MSSGKTHDKIGLLVGVIGATILSWWFTWEIIASFIAGWLLALFIFSPDSDLGPKKRTGIFAFILYPYALLFKHRGISHSLWFGTLTRVIYLLVTILMVIGLLNRLDYLSIISWQEVGKFILNYDIHRPIYQYITIFYVGMFGADAVHILLDLLSSFFNRIKRALF